MARDALTLDPQNWAEFRALAHRMVDDMLDHLAALREKPAWQPVPAEVRRRLDEPIPFQGQGAEAVYAQFLTDVLPYPNGNLHPRFFGWVQGNGTPLAMMADMLASGMNAHLAGFAQAPALVEAQVLEWLTQLMGFPETASGLLAVGGTMANVLGLAVARAAQAGFDVRERGLQGDGPQLTVYASSEVHGWLKKALDLLGLGHRALRVAPVGADHRVDVTALAARLDEDVAAGHRPICVVGTAGTVNTGATDDLVALSQLCRARRLWFHVDGAFGALARLSSELRPIVAGIEAADSLAFDLHKWMYLPFEVACVLVRDADLHAAAFKSTASYLTAFDRGVIAGGLPFSDRGVDLTRAFRALKVWMSLKAHGVDRFAALIEQNVAQAKHLEARVRASRSLEVLAPVALNVVCFRYVAEGHSDAELNALNTELLLRLQESGVAVPSSTMLGGRFALRCAIVNHRSRFEDFDLLVEEVLRLGATLAARRS